MNKNYEITSIPNFICMNSSHCILLKIDFNRNIQIWKLLLMTMTLFRLFCFTEMYHAN